MSRFRRFLEDASGVSAVEYALIVSLVALIAMASFSLLGGDVSGKLGELASALGGGSGTTSSGGSSGGGWGGDDD